MLKNELKSFLHGFDSKETIEEEKKLQQQEIEHTNQASIVDSAYSFVSGGMGKLYGK
jgi:hypothetical protein